MESEKETVCGVERGLGLLPSDTARSGFVDRAMSEQGLGSPARVWARVFRQRERIVQGPGEGGALVADSGAARKSKLVNVCGCFQHRDALGTRLLVTLLREYLFPRS